MPSTPREIVTLVIVCVLFFGGIAYLTTQFEKGPRSRTQEYALATGPTPAPATATPSDKDDAPNTPPPKERRLAPDGVFFLTERVTLKTKSGILSFAPGTGFRLVSQNGDTFRVTDGTTTLDVWRDKLTNDLDLAEIVAQSEYANQQGVAAYLGKQVELHQQNVSAENAWHERDLQAIEAGRMEALRLAAENMITPAEAMILNLREVHHDMSGNIMYGVATDGISVGPGQVRSFREQAELVKNHALPELTTEERRERWREDYLYTQQHKTPDVIVIQQH